MSAPTERPHLRPVGTPTPALLSPSDAAHHAQVSRRTIMRAIVSQELLAMRDNQNRWKIAPEDLDKWAGAQCAPSGPPTPLPSPVPSDPPTYGPVMPTGEGRGVEPAELLALTTRAVAAETRLEMLMEQMAELRQDRDRELAELRQDRNHWRTLADRLAGAVPKPVIEPEAEPEIVVEPVVEDASKPWWRRLLRGS